MDANAIITEIFIGIVLLLAGALVWWVEFRIKCAKKKQDDELAEKRKKEEEAAAQERLEREEAERRREEYLVILVQMVGASIALGEANSIALKNGKCNGETKKALEYASQVKHTHKDFLTEVGVKSLFN